MTALIIRRISTARLAPSGLEIVPTAASSHAADFVPPADVDETAEAYEIRMEVAGLNLADVAIELAPDDRTVTVTGVRRTPVPHDHVRFLNMEVGHGRFWRRFELPQRVDGERAEASYAQGFLTIRLPKRKSSGARRVSIEKGTPR